MAASADVDGDDAVHAAVVGRDGRTKAQTIWRYTPAFIFVFLVFLIGHYTVPDPRASLIGGGLFQISWVEILMLGAFFVAIFELLKVAQPGIDNTMEAIAMIVMAGIQVLLFALAVAEVRGLQMFANTEFLMITIINVAQSIAALLINARTLRRTITSS